MAKKTSPPIPWRLLKEPAVFLALGFGSGMSPKAPGTFGTLAAIPVYGLFMGLPPLSYAAVVAALAALGVMWCGTAAERLGVHDHPAIVWDEVVGFLIAMALVAPTWSTVAAGFVLFRVFDILKPWPIGWLDKHVHGGLGIMLDDVAAGALAAGCLRLLFDRGWLGPFL